MAPGQYSEDDEPEDVLCVCCGTTELSAFSHRMLKRRGRHGERTRRCLACVEKDAQPDARTAAACSACGAAVTPGDAYCAACAGGASEKQRKKLLKALRQVEELKQRLDGGEPLEQTQLEKIAREAEMRAQLELMQSSGTTGALQAQPAHASKRKQDRSGPQDAAWGAGGPAGQAVRSGSSAPSGL
jgi:hypothetical protein